MTPESCLIAKLQWAWDDGCPVAGSSTEDRARLASIARRRWASFKRRTKNMEDNRARRVEDLAKGLCEAGEIGGLSMAGPLISDYRWLAEQLADVLEADPRK